MKDWNTCFAYLNMELPDDIRRLKEAGYYNAAIARIDACLAEDWTASQNQPLHPQGALPVNPTPHGVDAWRQGLLAHREILRRLPQDILSTHYHDDEGHIRALPEESGLCPCGGTALAAAAVRGLILTVSHQDQIGQLYPQVPSLLVHGACRELF